MWASTCPLAGYNNRFHKGLKSSGTIAAISSGSMYDYFAIAFIFMPSFVVMIGGASAAVNQQYGLPGPVGGVAMGVLCRVDRDLFGPRLADRRSSERSGR